MTAAKSGEPGKGADDVTNEMCLAGMHAWENTFGTPLTRYAAIYNAMKAAAPSALIT